MSVAGKVVVITGGTRGIGRAVAAECVRLGAKVVLCGRCSEDAERAALEMTRDLSARPSSGGSTPADATALGVGADVRSYEEVRLLRDRALERHGRIDVWFNNAGISLGYAPVDEESPDDISRIIDINFTGHAFGCRAILPYFREHGGYLMNMVGRGYKGEATPHTAIYAATKTAVASLTLSIAEENKRVDNLSVNAIVPGMVETDFYEDLRVSPRLERSAGNWRYAMNAFGVPLETVARETAIRLGDEPGRETGKIYSLLTPGRTARGIAKMAWYGMSGKMARE